MLTERCYGFRMESTDGLVEQFERYRRTRHLRLRQEDAELLLGALYGAIEGLVFRETDLDTVGTVVLVFNELTHRLVAGADPKEGDYEAAFYERGEELSTEILNADRWCGRLEVALMKLGDHPPAERTVDNLRRMFLRDIAYIQLMCPPDVQLCFEDIGIDYTPL